MMKKVMLTLALLVLLLCLTGCGRNAEPAVQGVADVALSLSADVTVYLEQTRAQAQTIRASLENDPLTQTEMNLKSQELRELWEGAMARLLEEAQRILPEQDYAQLTAEQHAWETESQSAVDAASQPYAGGSIYALIVNTEAAGLTEERVNALYERLK